MSILICGSLAYDTLLTFDGAFDDHLLPDQLHKLSVCFRVPQLRREFGGCAGNIAYSLRLLGGEPLIMATVGADFAPYRAHLNRLGIASSHIREIPDTYTAQCFITSDRADNQITAFHPGAMDFASQNHAHSAQGMRLAIVAPSGHPAAMQFCRELTAMGTPFVFERLRIRAADPPYRAIVGGTRRPCRSLGGDAGRQRLRPLRRGAALAHSRRACRCPDRPHRLR